VHLKIDIFGINLWGLVIVTFNVELKIRKILAQIVKFALVNPEKIVVFIVGSGHPVDRREIFGDA
jgi:hypothetical protein